MDRREALWRIDATLKAKGFRETGPGIADYEGTVPVHGKPVDIGISIPDVRFASKPVITLKDRSQIPLDTLAHIEIDSGICYATGPGLPIDLYQPGEAILRVLEEARRTLELSFRGRAAREIIDEFQHYWHSELNVRCMVAKRGSASVIHATLFVAMIGKLPTFMCLAEQAALRGYDAAAPRPAQIWYVDNPVGPAAGIRAPKTLAQLQRWFAGQAGLTAKRWDAAFHALAEGQTLFVAAPNAFVGLRLAFPKDLEVGLKRGSIRQQAMPRLLSARPDSILLDRYSGAWCSIEDLTARNSLAQTSLKGKSIALVGCGTVGSHLARMLVQSGAGIDAPFSVFDKEILSEGNIGRHLLGFGDIDKPKALALQAELERFHPQAKIHPYAEDATELWEQLAAHDLIVDTTGEWNVQSALNEQFLSDTAAKSTALLHAWVFMNGAGAQSFLNCRDEFACFRCLKPQFDGPWRYPAGDEKDELNLQPAACGDGAFIPFTVDASCMAASLANRAAVDWAAAKAGPRLRTVQVDPERGRYQKPVSPKPSPQCPACSARRSAE